MLTSRLPAVLVSALVLGACAAPAPDPADGAGVPDMAAMEARMAELATPGTEHARFEPMIGAWDATLSAHMSPDAPPVESSGECVNAWALGGRFVQASFDGTFMDMPFEGHGFFGYDKARATYCGFWIDNSGTQMMANSTGTYSEADRAFRMSRPFIDPMTGGTGELREVITIHSDDHHALEMWMVMDDQEPTKLMTVDYTRKVD